MRQTNGAELLGTSDPCSSEIGIIHVTPSDDRTSVLAAILTQDKLGRKQVVVVLPGENKAFQHPVDFDGLKNMRRRLKTQIVFVVPAGSRVAEYARQRRFPVYASLENYAQSLQAENQAQLNQKQQGLFGLPFRIRQEPTNATAPSPSPKIINSKTTRPLPSLSSDLSKEASSDAKAIASASEDRDKSEATTLISSAPLTGNDSEGPSKHVVDLPSRPAAKKQTNRGRQMTNETFVYYINPEEDLMSVRERLEQVSERSIILIVPAKALLRSHVAWRILHTRARELHKEIIVISPDRQIRAVAKAAGLPVAASVESPLRSRLHPNRGGIRRPAPRTPAPRQLDGAADKKSDMAEMSEKGDTNSISSAPDGQEDDPFAYMEDYRSSSLPEQRGSAPIEDFSQVERIQEAVEQDDIDDFPPPSQKIQMQDAYSEVIDRPPEIEDLGDQGDILPKSSPLRPLYLDEEELDIPRPTHIYGTRPRGSRLGNLPPIPQQEDEDVLSPLPEQPVPLPPLSKRPSGSLAPEAGPGNSQPIIPRRPQGPRVVQPLPRRGIGTGTAIPPVATRGQRSWRLLIALFLLGLLFLGGWIFFSGVFCSATVTITPASQDMRESYVMSAVTGTPKASQRQVQARILSYTPSSQTKIVPATGVGHDPATQAHGSLTLYNALSSTQTIAAGTVLTDANGVQVVNDRVTIIPGAKPPTEGVVTVPAHTVNTGSNTNIPAFDFNNVPSSIVGITVQNKTAFSGGQDSQVYTYVQQSDIDNVVSEMKKTLEQNAQTLLRMQILPGEQLLGSSIPCTVGTTSDHAAGDKAASVTVTITDTCTGEVYDQQGARLMAENLLKSEATKSLGGHYLLVGNVVTTVMRATVIDKRATISLLVNAVGRWVYQFDDTRKKELAKLIAGKNKESAQALLRSAEGVSKGDIELSFFSLNSLPDDPDKITVLV